MSKHFLQYWKAAQVVRERKSSNPFVDHSGSEQLYKVNPGDTVWIVTVIKGVLLLLGKIQVGARTKHDEAVKLLGRGNLWESTYHVIAEAGTAEPMREINLMEIAQRLRFVSSTNRDRLTIINGHADGKQLQAIRELSPASIALLESEWAGSNFVIEFEEGVKKGAGFGNPETNKKVERAAVSFVIEWYESKGWVVTSVEANKCGYDLLCSKDSTKEHVEVKGIQGTKPQFIITANELHQALNNPFFVLCVVTGALSDNRQLNCYRGSDFIKKFNLTPLAYRAALRL
jgi:hypothetical protein